MIFSVVSEGQFGTHCSAPSHEKNHMCSCTGKNGLSYSNDADRAGFYGQIEMQQWWYARCNIARPTASRFCPLPSALLPQYLASHPFAAFSPGSRIALKKAVGQCRALATAGPKIKRYDLVASAAQCKAAVQFTSTGKKLLTDTPKNVGGNDEGALGIH